MKYDESQLSYNWLLWCDVLHQVQTLSSVWVHLLKSGMINGTWGITSNQGKLWNIAKGEILNQGATEQRKTMRCRGDHVGHGGHVAHSGWGEHDGHRQDRTDIYGWTSLFSFLGGTSSILTTFRAETVKKTPCSLGMNFSLLSSPWHTYLRPSS